MRVALSFFFYMYIAMIIFVYLSLSVFFSFLISFFTIFSFFTYFTYSLLSLLPLYSISILSTRFYLYINKVFLFTRVLFLTSSVHSAYYCCIYVNASKFMPDYLFDTRMATEQN